MRGTIYRGPPRNAINHVARVSSGVNGANPFVKFHVSGVKRAMLRDAPADIMPRRLLPPLSRSSLLCPRAAKWRINPRSQFNRRGNTAADFLFFRGDKFAPAEQWASPDRKIDRRNSRLILFTACNALLSRLRV